MKYAIERAFADPEKAAIRLMDHAQAFDPIQDGRIYIEKINGPFLFGDKGTPAEYGRAGLRDREVRMVMDWRSLETFSFGDHPALADELVELVLGGKKRATCWAVSEGLKGAAVGKPMVALDVRSPALQPAGRLYPQLRTWPCTAQTDALCQQRAIQ